MWPLYGCQLHQVSKGSSSFVTPTTITCNQTRQLRSASLRPKSAWMPSKSCAEYFLVKSGLSVSSLRESRQPLLPPFPALKQGTKDHRAMARWRCWRGDSQVTERA